MKGFFLRFLCLFVCLGLAACGILNPPSEFGSGGGSYRVKKSDTLYSIAWRYGLDYQELARWNRIGKDYIIHPGQRLVLIEPRNSRSVDNASAPPQAVAEPETAVADVSSVASVGSSPVDWQWPSSGKIMNRFQAGSLDQRGIDIAGERGQDIYAVANGKVVYSGNGLAGYGNLIIIKHSETYLSAYAYNQRRLVNEGMTVKAGTVISKMGQHPDGSTRLHFEIRKNGKPVDPLQYLPRL